MQPEEYQRLVLRLLNASSANTVNTNAVHFLSSLQLIFYGANYFMMDIIRAWDFSLYYEYFALRFSHAGVSVISRQRSRRLIWRIATVLLAWAVLMFNRTSTSSDMFRIWNHYIVSLWWHIILQSLNWFLPNDQVRQVRVDNTRAREHESKWACKSRSPKYSQ